MSERFIPCTQQQLGDEYGARHDRRGGPIRGGGPRLEAPSIRPPVQPRVLPEPLAARKRLVGGKHRARRDDADDRRLGERAGHGRDNRGSVKQLHELRGRGLVEAVPLGCGSPRPSLVPTRRESSLQLPPRIPRWQEPSRTSALEHRRSVQAKRRQQRGRGGTTERIVRGPRLRHQAPE